MPRCLPISRARSVKNMENHGNSYGFPPYEDDPNTNGSDPYAPRSYRDNPAAGNNDPTPYGQESDPYGQQPYAYGQDGGGYSSGNAGYPGSDYTARHPRTDYTQRGSYAPNADASYTPGDGYAPGEANPYADGNYAQDANNPYASGGGYENDAYGTQSNTQRTAYGASDYSNQDAAYTTRRTNRYYDETEGYTTGRTAVPHEDSDYTPRGATGRTAMPGGSYDRHAGSERYASDQRRPESYDDESYDRPERPYRSRKKRSKFAKFMHALGLYLAQLPAKTLVIFGGSFAMVLVAIILLAVLLPNSARTERADDGQLALSDITPTPSIAPTNTPAPTEEVTPSPAPAVLEENISVSGTVSDLIPDIQKRLVELGYMDEPEGGYTDKYGPTTKTAIRLFQMKNFDDSNDWDGIIGNDTYNLLMSDDAKAYYLSRGDGDDRTKVITKLVQDVTSLQNRLIELGYLPAGSATGLYGASTVTAVQKFQEYHGLTADGKAGQETLTMLYSADAMDATTGAANNLSKVTPTPSVAGSTTTTDATTTTPAP